MDDYLEIDIKKLIKQIISKWVWIVGVTLVICVATFLFFNQKPDSFSAKAKIALVRPTLRANFSTQITTTDLPLPTEGFILNAVKSNEIISALYAEWSNENKSAVSLESFASQHLVATLESKGAVIILEAKFTDPDEAAKIANSWAKMAIQVINGSYYGIIGDVEAYFEFQLSSSQTKLIESGKALEEFAKTDDSTVLNITLNNLNAEVTDIEQRKQTLEAAQFDLNAMIDYLKRFPGEDQVRESDLLNFTLVQTRVYGSPVVAGLAGSPVQLQLSLQPTVEKLTYDQFTKVIQDWNTTLGKSVKLLNADNSILVTKITEIESQLLSLKNQKLLLQNEYDLYLLLQKNLRGELEELLLKTSSASYGNAQLLSSAIVPQESIPHNTARNTLIAAVASVVLTSIAIMLIDWWKSDKKTEEDIEA